MIRLEVWCEDMSAEQRKFAAGVMLRSLRQSQVCLGDAFEAEARFRAMADPSELLDWPRAQKVAYRALQRARIAAAQMTGMTRAESFTLLWSVAG